MSRALWLSLCKNEGKRLQCDMLPVQEEGASTHVSAPRGEEDRLWIAARKNSVLGPASCLFFWGMQEEVDIERKLRKAIERSLNHVNQDL